MLLKCCFKFNLLDVSIKERLPEKIWRLNHATFRYRKVFHVEKLIFMVSGVDSILAQLKAIFINWHSFSNATKKWPK